MSNNLKLIDKEIAMLLESKDAYPKSDLYHYTDMLGLEGILSTRRLWMTHYESLTDESEVKYAHTEALKLIENHIAHSKNPIFWRDCKQKFKDILKIGDYFICSFSKFSNNNKLWSDYAKSDGVAIKFCREYFTPIASLNKKKRRYNLVTSQFVQYQIDEFKTRGNMLLSIIEKHLDINNLHMSVQLGTRLMTYFLTDMPKVKNEEFSHEQECRLYQFGFNSETNNNAEKQDRIYAIPQVYRNDKLRVLRKFKQKDICEIVLGSRNHIKTILKLLHKYQFSGVKIRYR